MAIASLLASLLHLAVAISIDWDPFFISIANGILGTGVSLSAVTFFTHLLRGRKSEYRQSLLLENTDSEIEMEAATSTKAQSHL